MRANELAAKLQGAFEVGSGKAKKPYAVPAGGYTAAATAIETTVAGITERLGASYAWVYAMLVGLAMDGAADGFGPVAANFKIRDAKMTTDERWPQGESASQVFARLCLEPGEPIARGKASIIVTALRQGGTVQDGKAGRSASTAHHLASGLINDGTVFAEVAAATVAALPSSEARRTASAANGGAAMAVSPEAMLAAIAALPLDQRRMLCGLPAATAAETAAERKAAVKAAKVKAAAALKAKADAAAVRIVALKAELAAAEADLSGATVGETV